MNIWADLDERARRLGIMDTKLVQGAAIFFALIIVKLFPQILSLDLLWFIGLCMACAIKPMFTFFGPEK